MKTRLIIAVTITLLFFFFVSGVVYAQDNEIVSAVGLQNVNGIGLTTENIQEKRVVVKAVYPSSEGRHDEKNINPKTIDGITRYFLKITFDDVEGNLTFNTSQGLTYLRTSKVFPVGSIHANLIDIEFLNFIQSLAGDERQGYISEYIFVKDEVQKLAHLYVPISLLNPQTVYEVTINSNIVFIDDDSIDPVGNELISWHFMTMGIPYVASISPGTVIENYDDDYPIIIKGDFFNTDTIDVYFDTTGAYRVYVRTFRDGTRYLEVYLPRGSRQLEPGLYDVFVVNGSNHEAVAYGAFSVISEGEFIPNGELNIKGQIREGDIVYNTSTSEDILQLNRRYTDRSLDFNMDEIMGQDTLVRKIQFDTNSRNTIDELNTASMWADITLYGVKLDSGSRNDTITIVVGRAEPLVAQAAASKLWNYKLRSEIIEVAGENYTVRGISGAIPYNDSDGTNLKVLRYDETLRKWTGVNYYTVNYVNRKVYFHSNKPGIFAVVE